MLTGMDIKVGIVAPSEVERNLERLYTIQDSMDDASLEFVDGVTAEMDLSQAMGEANPDDAPVIQLVNNVIEQAVREGASDPPRTLREKHPGPLPHRRPALQRLRLSQASAPAVSSRMKIMSSMDISEKRRPQDGRILIKVLGRRVDLRVSSLPTIYGEKMVIRILDERLKSASANSVSTATTRFSWTKSSPPPTASSS
ncbi:hypothetical protein MASR2M17_01830 [Aminivibrio sp.]